MNHTTAPTMAKQSNLDYMTTALTRMIAALEDVKRAHRCGDLAALLDANDSVNRWWDQVRAAPLDYVPPDVEAREYDDEATDAAHRRAETYRDINEGQPK